MASILGSVVLSYRITIPGTYVGIGTVIWIRWSLAVCIFI